MDDAYNSDDDKQSLVEDKPSVDKQKHLKRTLACTIAVEPGYVPPPQPVS